MDETSNKYWALCIYLALVLTTLAVFWQVRNHDFVNYDDGDYITKNLHVQAGLTLDSITWAFTTGDFANWHPLTWLSHMLDCQLFGTNPGWHHLTSLLLHIANTLLLFTVFRQMTGALWRSAFVAAAFALHPLHVESVAWVAERKDVLSTFFWMLTMWAYVRYAEHPKPARYLLTVVFFALGLMAKPMLVTLPFVLLLLDYWPLDRLQIGKDVENANQPSQESVNTHSQRWVSYRLVREKVPFFALSAISSVVTFLVQQHSGAVKRIDSIPLIIRIANAFISYLKYIGKMVWPSKLAMFYPHSGDKLPVWQAAVAALLLLVISFWIIRLARSHRYLLVGWLWYLGTLVPVTGLVQVGEQALADRYSYVPLTGLFIIIAWGLYDLQAKWRYRKITLAAAAMMVLLALSICANLQQRYWRNSITLCEHALEVTKDNYVAHFCMTESLHQQGKVDQAIYHNSEAVRLKPNYLEAHNGLGLALLKAGRLDEAIIHFTKALEFKPDLAEARVNLGVTLVQQGNLDEAIKHYTEVLHAETLRKPDLVTVHENLGYALQLQGKFDEATTHYRKALQFEPDSVGVHINLGYILVRQGKPDEAIKHYAEAVRINPDSADAHYNLGVALFRQGKLDEAIRHYDEAVRIKPDFADAHSKLGFALAGRGKLDEAIKHYAEALRLKPDSADTHSDLGTALLQQGNLDEAVSHYRLALQLNPDDSETHNNLGIVLQSQGKLNEAISCFRLALRVKPNDADVHYNLGNALQSQGKLNEAVGHYRQALQVKPNDVETHYNLGIALKSQGKLDEAISHYRYALRFNPNHAPAHNSLGNALAMQGKLDEAIKHYNEALRIQPDYVEARKNLGNAFYQQGKLKEAVREYQQVLQMLPDNPDAHNDLGVAIARQGKLNEAITHFTEALRIKPDFADAHSNLGHALANQGKLDEAVTHLEEAVQLDPNFVPAHYQLALASAKKGKISEAITHLKETLRLRPDWVEPMNNLAWLLATHEETSLRSPQEAVQLAERACELTSYEDPGLLDTLAAAYAAAGKFPQAIETAEKALQLAQSSGQNELMSEIQNRLRLYKAGQPYIEH